MVGEDKADDNMVIAGNSHLVDVQFDCIGDYFDTMLHVLPVNGYGGGTAIVGLLLQPTGRAQGQYRRVGQFTFWDEWSSREFEKSCKVQDCQAREHEYSEIRREKDGTNNFIIDMI
jgi:hypothetical protein